MFTTENDVRKEQAKADAAEAEARAERLRLEQQRKQQEAEERARRAELRAERQRDSDAETNRLRYKINAVAENGSGDAFLELAKQYKIYAQGSSDLYDARELARLTIGQLKGWNIPADKENFQLFIRTLAINKDFIKEVENVRFEMGNQLYPLKGLYTDLVKKATNCYEVFFSEEDLGKEGELLKRIIQENTEEEKKKVLESNRMFVCLVLFFLVLTVGGAMVGIWDINMKNGQAGLGIIIDILIFIVFLFIYYKAGLKKWIAKAWNSNEPILKPVGR